MREPPGHARGQPSDRLQAVLVGHPQHQCVTPQRQLVAPRQRDRLEVGLQCQCAVQVAFDIDDAAEVRVGQQQRIGPQHEAAQQPGVADHERVLGMGLEFVQDRIAQPQRRWPFDACQQASQDAQRRSVQVRRQGPGERGRVIHRLVPSAACLVVRPGSRSTRRRRKPAARAATRPVTAREALPARCVDGEQRLAPVHPLADPGVQHDAGAGSLAVRQPAPRRAAHVRRPATSRGQRGRP